MTDKAVNKEVKNVEVTHNITLSYPCKKEADEEIKDIRFTLSLPIKSSTKTKELTDKIEDFKINDNDDLKKWLLVFEESINNYVEGGSFDESLKRENGDWKQEVIACNNDRLRISSISSNVKDGDNISDENLLYLINRSLDLGTVVKVPLWHSGFWVTIKAPSSGLLIAVDRVLSSEKIILGRQTNGMVYSGVSVYLRKTLMELLLDCIISTSIKNYKKSNLFDLIKVTDYQTLIWGLCCANNPDGYDLTQSCIADLNKCNNVITEKVMLSKLSWTDNDSLSDIEIDFMQKQKINKVDKDEVLNYQEGLNAINDIELGKVTVSLKVPTIAEDLRSGVKWVDSLVNMVDELFSETEINDDIRNIRIMEQSKASALRQYSAWINKILVARENGDNRIIESRDIIDSTCDSLTSNSKISQRIFKEIGEFIDESVISIIGIPSYNCPKCESPQGDEESKYPEIIPLSIDDIFFTLTRQLTELLIVRENTF